MLRETTSESPVILLCENVHASDGAGSRGAVGPSTTFQHEHMSDHTEHQGHAWAGRVSLVELGLIGKYSSLARPGVAPSLCKHNFHGYLQHAGGGWTSPGHQSEISGTPRGLSVIVHGRVDVRNLFAFSARNNHLCCKKLQHASGHFHMAAGDAISAFQLGRDTPEGGQPSGEPGKNRHGEVPKLSFFGASRSPSGLDVWVAQH
ncbi:hypothetical protein M8818_005391 [Zalaria obscura]|uniref:Uncharacterized protein n=1 Tax=Zalaria obscura TaxID=2024903 RepID=A0ACC3S8I0_9PEZI